MSAAQEIPLSGAFFDAMHGTPRLERSRVMTYCCEAVRACKPLSALVLLFKYKGIEYHLTGEGLCIIKFVRSPVGRSPRPSKQVPLRFSLWVAGYDGSQEVRVHSLTDTRRFHIENLATLLSLVELLRTSPCPPDRDASLKPKPLSDKILLDRLGLRPFSPENLYFAEGVRAVWNNSPLNASIHFLTPFGLHPIYNSKLELVTFQKVTVRFREGQPREAQADFWAARSSFLADVYIKRAPRLPCCRGISVLLFGPSSSVEAQTEQDDRRRLGTLASNTNATVDPASACALVYNLLEGQDRVCFVRRVLSMRDQARNLKESMMDREQYHGKYCSPQRYEVNVMLRPWNRERAIVQGPTPLSSVVGIEDAGCMPLPVIRAVPPGFSEEDRGSGLSGEYPSEEDGESSSENGGPHNGLDSETSKQFAWPRRRPSMLVDLLDDGYDVAEMRRSEEQRARKRQREEEDEEGEEST